MTVAYGIVVRSLVRVICELSRQVAVLETELTSTFAQHADADMRILWDVYRNAATILISPIT
jgi:hypothetical protein